MMWVILKAVSVASAVLSPAFAQTHDADFPDQMRAINHCYVQQIQMPNSNFNLKACVEEQGFRFCDDCKIFRYRGGLCKNDHDNGADRATCYRPVP
jgi:hypothetical protein